MYERKREFLNGINEKVSNILWIPPLYTTTETSIPPSEPPYVFQSDPQKYTEMDSDEDDVQNVEIVSVSTITIFIQQPDVQYFYCILVRQKQLSFSG